MGSNEIFYSLTRGVHFKKRKLEEDEKSHDKFSSKKFKKEFEDIVHKNEIEIFNKQRKAHEANEKTPKKEKQFLQGFLVKNTKLNDFRKKNKINVAGKRIPKAIQNFEALQVDYEVPKILIDNLNSCGFYVPTPVQMQATPVMLKGRNVMACAPTGSGKTVAFLIPIIRDLRVHQKKGFRCIILCPTRELAQQTYRETLRLTEKTGLKTHIISKVKKLEENYDLKFNNKYDILISTPNRVRFLLQFHPPKIDLSNIEWFIIDEADRLLEDGKNSFKEQFDDIWNACSNTSKKMGLFSATYTTQVAKWALRNLKQLVRITIGERNSATSLVDQELFFVGSESGKLLAIRNMIQNGLKPPVLIFVQSKDRAQQLLSELLYDGINVDVIHADRSQQQRDNVVKAFREGKIWVLICTELMSRGIDFKCVNLVINYDFPPTSISYIHRIGRTGRAGRRGKAVTFFTQEDQPNLRSIAHIIQKSGGQVPEFMLTLKKPKKSEKKKLANYAPKREDILTTPKFVLEKRKTSKENLSQIGNGRGNTNSKKHESFKEKLNSNGHKKKNFVLLSKRGTATKNI